MKEANCGTILYYRKEVHLDKLPCLSTQFRSQATLLKSRFPIFWDSYGRHGVINYRQNRENGDPIDQQLEFSEDGECFWKYKSNTNTFELKYTEGPGDRAWMEEKDHNYMKHIACNGTTTEKEQLAKEILQLTTKDKDNRPKKESYAQFFAAEIRKFEEEERKFEDENQVLQEKTKEHQQDKLQQRPPSPW